MEHALEVAHTVMDTFAKQGAPAGGCLRLHGWLAPGEHLGMLPMVCAGGVKPEENAPTPTPHPPPSTPPPSPAPAPGLFLDVPTGTQLLLLAVRRDVGDLSLAHRIYDGMHATQR